MGLKTVCADKAVCLEDELRTRYCDTWGHESTVKVLELLHSTATYTPRMYHVNVRTCFVTSCVWEESISIHLHISETGIHQNKVSK